ncbi:MAG: RteC domain-containing protein [Cyclobacteriaceae bacterium]
MQTPFDDLLVKFERTLLEIENNESVRMMKCAQKITLCQQLCKELRKLYFESQINTIDQQIHFFREVKPKFYSELRYQMEVFQYHKQRPKGSVKVKSQYINMCLDKASSFITRHCEFNTYIRLQSTHLDEVYFTSQEFCPKLHGNLEYPADPVYSSPADLTLSCMLAFIRYVQFLKNEMYRLKNPSLDPSWKYLANLQWQGSKTDMVELVYALHTHGAIKGELKDVVAVFQQIFRLDLGNFYRTYTDIKYKKNQTSFLDDLKSSLIEKIRLENE